MSKLIILRSCSGSGKSTHARAILADTLRDGLTCTIRSTDDQFIVNGTYKFNPRLLSQNHDRNQLLVEKDMKEGVNVIIVDNTNIKRSHMAPYKLLARKYDYEVEEVIVDNPDPSKVDLYFNRNLHGVSRSTIARQIKEFEI